MPAANKYTFQSEIKKKKVCDQMATKIRLQNIKKSL